MFQLELYVHGLFVALSLAVVVWLVSVAKRDVSIVDSMWSIFFLVMATLYLHESPDPGQRGYLLLFLVSLWAFRLSFFITRRNWKEPEDRRYQAIRADHEPHFWLKSLLIVFGLQAVLAWIISLPLHGTMTSAAPLGWLDALALLLWAIGFGFEAIGDQQLARFKADAANAGQVMDQGLWRYTRHPNYFGEACLWWGYYLFAVAAGAWWSFPAPILMTILLLRVSGVALLEKDISVRRPAYQDYIRRTSAFIPLPPKTL